MNTDTANPGNIKSASGSGAVTSDIGTGAAGATGATGATGGTGPLKTDAQVVRDQAHLSPEEKKAKATKDSVDPTLTDDQRAAAKAELAAPDGFMEAADVKVGGSHLFYNTGTYTIQCPYSKERFPAGNFTPEPVEVNEWIKSQVDAGLLKAKK